VLNLCLVDGPNPHLGNRINKHNWSYRIQLAKNWSHAFAPGFYCILAIVELSGQVIRVGEWFFSNFLEMMIFTIRNY